MSSPAMHEMESRYSAARGRLRQRMAAGIAAAHVNPEREASLLAGRLGVDRKRRAPSEYEDVADCLLARYTPEVAYAVAVEINELCERRVGYPPIGQTIVALERRGGERAARLIACSLLNFPKAETARLAFGVFKSEDVRSLIRAELEAQDAELAEYICAGPAAAPPGSAQPARRPPVRQAEAPSGPQRLSDGIERMPRLLTEAERRADRLFLHLQAVSLLTVLLFPVLGAIYRGWAGAAVGLAVGWCARVWMRRSMGLRGPNPDEGFFVRMRERANGSRRGLLEVLIERVRRRPFTKAQCAAVTRAWDDTRRLLADASSAEEKRRLVEEFDEQMKRISYGEDASTSPSERSQPR